MPVPKSKFKVCVTLLRKPPLDWSYGRYNGSSVIGPMEDIMEVV
jgi:hypothetical protein